MDLNHKSITFSTTGSNSGGLDNKLINTNMVKDKIRVNAPASIRYGSTHPIDLIKRCTTKLETMAMLAAKGVARFQLKPSVTTGTTAAAKSQPGPGSAAKGGKGGRQTTQNDQGNGSQGT